MNTGHHEGTFTVKAESYFFATSRAKGPPHGRWVQVREAR